MNKKERKELNKAMSLIEDWFIQQEKERKPDIRLIAKAYNLLTGINDNVRIIQKAKK